MLVKWQQVVFNGDRVLRYNMHPTLDDVIIPHTHPTFDHVTFCTQGEILVRLEMPNGDISETKLVPGDPGVLVPSVAFHSIIPLVPDSISCCNCPRYDAEGKAIDLRNLGVEVKR